jgi:hypothetical protein
MNIFQKISSDVRKPVLSRLIVSRVMATAILAFAAFEMLAAATGTRYPCPFHELTTLPCPGCGLTRSIKAFCSGHFIDSLAWHPLGPPFFLILLFTVITAMLPRQTRSTLLLRTSALESRTAFGAYLIALLIALWIVRLLHLAPFHAI